MKRFIEKRDTPREARKRREPDEALAIDRGQGAVRLDGDACAAQGLDASDGAVPGSLDTDQGVVDAGVGALEAHLGAVDARGLERGRASARGQASVGDKVDAKAEVSREGRELLEVLPHQGLAAGEGEEGYLGLLLEDADDFLPVLGRKLLRRARARRRPERGRRSA